MTATMPYLQSIRVRIEDEERNLEYVAILRVETDDEAPGCLDDDGSPVLHEVRVLETRVLDERGHVLQRVQDAEHTERVIQLLDDPLELNSALRDGKLLPEPEAGQPAANAAGRLRSVVARRRAADRRHQDAG